MSWTHWSDRLPPADDEYFDYLRRRIETGWITERAAYMGIKARAPHLTHAEAKKRLMGG